MLSRTYRISTQQFPVVTRGKVVQNDLFRVVTKTDTTLRNPKCAVIVSNKVAKTAVARNRIRRQVYEALRKNIAQLPVVYISVFPKKVPMTDREIKSGLSELLIK